MGKVKVQVLKPFGEHTVGAAEVEESRLPYLVEKGLVSLSPGTTVFSGVPEVLDTSLQEIVGRIATNLSLEQVEGELIHDFLEKVADRLEQIKSEQSEQQSPQEADTTVSFLEYMEQKVDNLPVIKDIVEKYTNPEALSNASNTELMAFEGVNAALALRMKRTASAYKPVGE